MVEQLRSDNHDRDVVGMRYLYPVVSRRAGGVSIGINLNPNHACNWHCVYCQVPNLVRGSAPEIDLLLLEKEMSALLTELLEGDFMQRRVPESARRLCDIAISGNGEPTSCRAFDRVVAVVITVARRFGLQLPLRLITNGSYVHKPHVQRGLAMLADYGGEVWLKVDRVTAEGITAVNGVTLSATRLRYQLKQALKQCPTWLQSCMFAWDGEPPSKVEQDSYIAFLVSLKREHVPLEGVLLYGLARPSLQPEAKHLSALPQAWMERFALRIREESGFEVRLSL